MRRNTGILSGIVIVSLMVNGWLGIRLYQNTRILQMDSDEYSNFKQWLTQAMIDTDHAKNAAPGSTAQRKDMVIANMDLTGAMGSIMGLRTDLAKKGMDVYPIYTALVQSQSPDPFDSGSESKVQRAISANVKTLHHLHALLGPTSFTKKGLLRLRAVVKELDSQYPGYPSYTSLQ